MISNPLKYNVKIKHSEKNNAWNIIGTMPGSKYKIARIPYSVLSDEDTEYAEIHNTREKAEALEIAQYMVNAINNHREL